MWSTSTSVKLPLAKDIHLQGRSQGFEKGGSTKYIQEGGSWSSFPANFEISRGVVDAVP